jgi:hypothetical protein
MKNENWLDEWKGDLQFWSGLDKNGFQLKECVEKIFPSFNRMIIFRNAPNSYHGFPDRIECPTDVTRKAIVAYYYLDSPENDKISRTGGGYFLRSSDEISSEILQYIEKRFSGHTPISKGLDHE